MCVHSCDFDRSLFYFVNKRIIVERKSTKNRGELVTLKFIDQKERKKKDRH